MSALIKFYIWIIIYLENLKLKFIKNLIKVNIYCINIANTNIHKVLFKSK